MRKTLSIYTLILFIIGVVELVFLTGCCEKEPKVIEPSRQELLTSTWWRLKYHSWPVTEQIYFMFKSDGLLIESDSINIKSGGTWALKDNDKTLYIYRDILTDINDIIILTDTELKYTPKFWQGENPPVSTFKAFTGSKPTNIGASNLTKTSVKLFGVVRTSQTAAVVVFEYGPSSGYGQEAYPANRNIPALSLDNIEVSLSGLDPGTTYHYRIRAVCNMQTYYGDDLTFQTYNAISLNDINGNVYNTVNIGTQVWMAENLKVTNFNDGSSIQLVTEDSKWGTMTSPAYCWYNNDSLAYKNNFGALYNWFTVKTGKLCPIGWHVTSDQDWTNLEQYLGTKAGSKLYEYGTNITGFTAKQGGFRWHEAGYFGPVTSPYYWTTTEENTSNAFRWIVENIGIYKLSSVKQGGYYVRCLKDN